MRKDTNRITRYAVHSLGAMVADKLLVKVGLAEYSEEEIQQQCCQNMARFLLLCKLEMSYRDYMMGGRSLALENAIVVDKIQVYF